MEGGFRSGTILLEKYRIESLVGRGGMGVVLRVTHLHLGEELAVKILLPDVAVSPDAHARFLREAQSAVRLRGEHVARVIDVGILPEGAPYMVMEYLRGLDLSDELRRRGILPVGEAVDYVLQACEALAEAHANGIVHRDIKPGNLFLAKRPDGTPLVKVLDFGISKTPVGARGELTKTDSVMGTPGYMSPEQMKAAKDTDARTDIWALGVILYECLTGRRPFDAEAYSAVVLMTATEPPPPMDRRIPRALQAAVLRCLEKDRKARFPSIAALAAALAPFARDQRGAALIVDRTDLISHSAAAALEQPRAPAQSSQATTLSGSTSGSQSRARHRSYAIVGVTAVAVSLAGFSTVLLGSGRSRRSSEAVTVNDLEAASGADAGAPVASADVLEGSQEPAGDIERTHRAKLDECAEHKIQHRWQALEGCAEVLDGLGAIEEAKAFRSTARREHDSELAAEQLHQALRAGRLKGGQEWLKKIDRESVYFAAARDEFDGVEAAQAIEVVRKAEGFARSRSCSSLTRYVAELAATSTERIAGAAQAVPCGRAVPLAGAAATFPANASCAAMNVDDTMALAERRSKAGHAAEALTLVRRALACKEDMWMYQAATLYACSAHDPLSAQLYFTRAPTAFQGILEAHCKGAGIILGDVPAAGTGPPVATKSEHPSVDRSDPSSGANNSVASPATTGQRQTDSRTLAASGRDSPRPAESSNSPPDANADPTGADRSASSRGSGASTPAVVPACRGANVEELLGKAMKLYAANDASGALASMVKALECRQEARLFRFAVLFACAAHDFALAKLYFARVPAQYQPSLEQRCQQEGFLLREP